MRTASFLDPAPYRRSTLDFGSLANLRNSSPPQPVRAGPLVAIERDDGGRPAGKAAPGRWADCHPDQQRATRGSERLLGRNSQDDSRWLRYESALPADAHAVIERVPAAVNQIGRAHTRQWRLRFLQRKRPFADPLTGWTGGEDPLIHTSLRFPTREAAERYCARMDLPYDVHEPVRSPAHADGGQLFRRDDPPLSTAWPSSPAQ